MRKISISFVSDKLKEELIFLKEGDDSDRQLNKFITRAFYDVQNNLHCCIKIPKKLWPKEYKKYNITNLWKSDLPNAYRLIFTLEEQEIIVIALILEWFSHKEYEMRFRY